MIITILLGFVLTVPIFRLLLFFYQIFKDSTKNFCENLFNLFEYFLGLFVFVLLILITNNIIIRLQYTNYLNSFELNIYNDIFNDFAYNFYSNLVTYLSNFNNYLQRY